MDGGTGGLLGRRVRALSHLAPVFDLHLYRHRNPSDVDFGRYDFLGLTLVCVDTVALGSGMAGEEGVDRDHVIDEVAAVAARMAPDRPSGEHVHVANVVVNKLLRSDEPTTHFEVEVADPDDGWQVGVQRVRLLYETLAADGRTPLVNADPAAVNLLLVATDVDIADAQVAAHAVLEAQIASGRLPSAADKAREGLQLSRMYATAVRRMIAEAQRDVGSVGFTDRLGPELDAATDHLDARMRDDSALLLHVGAAISESESADDVAELAGVQRSLRESHEVLAGLHRQIIGAAGEWRRAQAGQAFVPAWAGSVEPAKVSLDPILTGGLPTAESTVAPTHSRRLLPLTALVDELTRPPRRAVEHVERDAADGDLEDVVALWSQFPDVYHDVADALRHRRVPPGGKARLSELFDDAERFVAAGTDLAVALVDASDDADAPEAARRLRLLLALDAMLMWRPEEAPTVADTWWASADGRRLAGDLDLPDMMLHRTGEDR